MSAETTKKPQGWAGFFLLLTGLWVLTGALFKLLYGTPNDLPQVVRELPLEIGLAYKLIIGIEFCVVVLCLFKRRYAWPVVIGMLVLFDAILIQQISSGEATCGCFGSKLQVSPWFMLCVDSFLLLGILTGKPWRLRGKGIPMPFIYIFFGAALTVPWLLDRQVTAPPLPPAGTPGGTKEPDLTGSSADPAANTPTDVDATPDIVPASKGWVALDVEDWTDMQVSETELARWIDLDSLIQDGKWVLYRSTCDHCAEHLENMALNDTGMTPITLIRVKEVQDSDENRMVHVMPTGPHVMKAALPMSVEWVVTTPLEMHLEAGRIVRVVEDED